MTGFGRLSANTPTRVRLERYTNRSGDCWLWTGAIDKTSGYGRLQVNGACGYAHRVAYEEYVGPIPKGLHIDHLCRVRACCNPDHLEPVTSKVNTNRSPIGPASRSSCPYGHPYEGDNLRVHTTRGTEFSHRQCRTCNIVRCALWRDLTPEQRAERKAAGLPVVDLAAHFAAHFAEQAAA